jgi:hypothetical protein
MNRDYRHVDEWGKGTTDQTEAPAEPRMTLARRKALEILIRADADGHPATVKNRTDPEARFVFWQVADWLVREDLAVTGKDEWGKFIRLTAKGREFARQAVAS